MYIILQLQQKAKPLLSMSQSQNQGSIVFCRSATYVHNITNVSISSPHRPVQLLVNIDYKMSTFDDGHKLYAVLLTPGIAETRDSTR